MFTSASLQRRVLTCLLIATLVPVVAGIVRDPAFLPYYWKGRTLLDFAAWSAACILAALVVHVLARRLAPPLLLGGVAAYLVAGVGPIESLAVCLLLGSAFVIGRALLDSIAPSARSPEQAVLVGFAAHLAVFGVLLHYSVNSRPLYVALLALPLLGAWRPGHLRPAVRSLARQLEVTVAALDAMPRWSFVAALVIVGHVARFALFPSVAYDDNALHLRMWTELAHRGQYSFDVRTQIWSVAPFAVDLLHAIASLVAGADARGALNLAFLGLLLRGLWALLVPILPAARDRLLCLALFASTPMLANLLTSLQTELFLAMLASIGVALALDPSRRDFAPRLAVALAIAALACATKLPGAVLGATLMLANLPALRRAWGSAPVVRRKPLAAAALLLVLLAFTALHAYAAAWRITGNPVFPLYNGIFKSPFFWPSNFADSRYLRGFSVGSYVELFFDTGRYFESRDFVAGFQYLLLPFIGAAAVCVRPQRFLAWALLVPTFGFGLVMFHATQYWRYMFPVLPLAVALIACLLARAGMAPQGRTPAIARAVLWGYVAINLYFLPGASWMFSAPPHASFTAAGREAVTLEFAPAKALTAHLDRSPDGETRVLYDVDVPFGATLAGLPVYLNWYSPARADRARNLADDRELAAFLADERVTHVVWDVRASDAQSVQRALMRRHLARFGHPLLEAGPLVLYRLDPRPVPYRSVLRVGAVPAGDPAPATASPPLRLAPGEAGDFPFAARDARALRYTVAAVCPDDAATLVAQIEWSTGARHHRAFPCAAAVANFAQAVPVPAHAEAARFHIGVEQGGAAVVTALHLESY